MFWKKEKETVSHKFTPQKDITTYELAVILANFVFWGNNMRYVISDEKRDRIGLAIRHFSRIWT